MADKYPRPTRHRRSLAGKRTFVETDHDEVPPVTLVVDRVGCQVFQRMGHRCNVQLDALSSWLQPTKAWLELQPQRASTIPFHLLFASPNQDNNNRECGSTMAVSYSAFRVVLSFTERDAKALRTVVHCPSRPMATIEKDFWIPTNGNGKCGE